jgi:predicted DNA-binding transcriptional regulator YafY
VGAVTFRTDRPAWVAELVVMAGGHARVVAPPQLATRVRERASAALASYADL